MAKQTYTEAQREANERWRKKNRERTQYLNKRSITKSFILNLATTEDIQAIKRWLQERATKE